MNSVINRSMGGVGNKNRFHKDVAFDKSKKISTDVE